MAVLLTMLANISWARPSNLHLMNSKKVLLRERKRHTARAAHLSWAGGGGGGGGPVSCLGYPTSPKTGPLTGLHTHTHTRHLGSEASGETRGPGTQTRGSGVPLPPVDGQTNWKHYLPHRNNVQYLVQLLYYELPETHLCKIQIRQCAWHQINHLGYSDESPIMNMQDCGLLDGTTVYQIISFSQFMQNWQIVTIFPWINLHVY